MDPITLITTALVAGAVAASKDVAAQAVKDAYAGLKALIVRKFGAQSDAEDAMEAVEKRPDSEARQAMLAEELAIAKAAEDAEVLKQAQALLDLLQKSQAVDTKRYIQQIQNSIVAQDIQNSTLAQGGSAAGETVIVGDQGDRDIAVGEDGVKIT
jgi:hypothetical protein